MEKVVFTRQNLETLSTAELMEICKNKGITIPENLSRHIVIGEILDMQFEDNDSSSQENIKVESVEEDTDYSLPTTYNDTKISTVLRNPAWAFVYWDISEADLTEIKSNKNFESIFMRVSFFNNAEDEAPFDSFDIQLNLDSNEQYVLLPPDRKYFMITLAYSITGEQPKILEHTKIKEIPFVNKKISNMQPGQPVKMNSFTKLSGMDELLHDHFLNHRQAFSN